MNRTTFTSWDDHLSHFGIKGQRWHVRRFQNEDGTLTEEGKKRYYNSEGKLTEDGALHLYESALRTMEYSDKAKKAEKKDNKYGAAILAEAAANLATGGLASGRFGSLGSGLQGVRRAWAHNNRIKMAENDAKAKNTANDIIKNYGKILGINSGTVDEVVKSVIDYFEDPKNAELKNYVYYELG